VQEIFKNDNNLLHSARDVSQTLYDIQYRAPLAPSHGQHHCVAILADEDLVGTILSLQCTIYNVRGEGTANGPPEPYFYAIPIFLNEGYNVIWWEANTFYQHYSQNAKWGEYPFSISFPTMQTSHFILTENGQYLPHHKQTSYTYIPGELNPPSLTRVHTLSTPPSLFHSSLISAGLLIEAYPPLRVGAIGEKRKPTLIGIDLSNIRDRIAFLLSRPGGGGMG
jgi:hypothetical protein